jgi:molybdopterin molybdotransferase
MAAMLLPLDDVSFAEAQAAFLAAAQPLAAVTVPLAEAQGFALAARLYAPMSLPPYDNSAMDGYALRSVEVAGASSEQPVVLEVAAGEATAGHTLRVALAAGQVARIMTGALLPAGADTVLPEEEATVDEGKLIVHAPLLADRHVRRAGEDVVAGSSVLTAGATLGPTEVALLAALGVNAVRVVRRARVAVLTTGDELRLPGEQLGECSVYNANLFALCSQIREAGAEPMPLPAVADEPDAIALALEVALQADAVVTSAGMGAGGHDHIAAVLGHRGAFAAGCLRLRPARHVGLALIDQKPVFALPGNPAASLIAFELLVRPAILRLGGHRRRLRPEILATLTAPIEGRHAVTQAVWVTVQRERDAYTAFPAGQQGAGVLSTAARADGLILMPEDVERYARGDVVTVRLLRG